jgi:hypothetical protein
MLDTFTIETFQPHVGQIFTFIVDGQPMPTKLTEIHRWGEGAAAGRTRHPFSLIFHTVPQAVVPQAMYRVESDVLEPMELFLAPIGPDERGMRYEAVFT